MIMKILQWYKLVKFIKQNRNEGTAAFKILTDSDTIIIISNPREYKKTNKIRLRY